MKAIVMHRILNFIYNNNIDIVEEIFKDKIPNYLHLMSKKNKYKRETKDNTHAWLEFIGHLDADNSEIIFDHITAKNKL